MRRWFGGGLRRRSSREGLRLVSQSEPESFDAELAEFLAAEPSSIAVDPIWKEALRESLWEYLETRRELDTEEERYAAVAEARDSLRSRARA